MCGSQKNSIIDLLVLLLVALNLCAIFFPAILLEPENRVSNATYFQEFNAALFNTVSSIISPILMVIGIVFYLLEWGRIAARNKRILIASALTFLAVALSASVNQAGGFKIMFIVIYFMVANLFLFGVMEFYSIPVKAALNMLRRLLTVWALLPLGLIVIYPTLFDYFFKPEDMSFHGFIDSRVGYGLWLGLLIILLSTQPEVYLRKWLLLISIVAMLLCQSRAGIVSLGFSYAYFYYKKYGGGLNRAFITSIGLMLGIILAAFIAWSVFGRGEVFTAVNITRALVYASFFDFISTNWLFGYGDMFTVTMPGGLLTDAPVHNLLLQTLANYGVIALGCSVIYWTLIYLDVKSTVSRMLLIFIFVYSQLEPVQGTANFFSPITLIWFLVIVMLRRARFEGNHLVI